MAIPSSYRRKILRSTRGGLRGAFKRWKGATDFGGSTRRRYRGNAPATIVKQPRGMNPAPLGERLFTTLEYAYSDVVTGGTSYFDKQFNANGIYDTDVSVGGVQPLGFDELMAFFQKYRVHSYEIDVWAINNSATPFQMTLIPSNTTSAYVNIDEARAAPRAVTAIAVDPTAQGKPLRLKQRFLIRDIVGCNKAEFSDENFAGDASANPAHIVRSHVYLGNLNGGITISAYISYRMRFKVEFYDRKQLALS